MANSQIEVYTAQMAQWRKVKSLGIELTDITIKSGITAFAPAFTDVMAYKRGDLSQEKYTEIYLDRMKRSQQMYPEKWDALVDKPKAAYMCYCSPWGFCHRFLFVDLVKEYMTKKDIEVIYKGEILATDIRTA